MKNDSDELEKERDLLSKDIITAIKSLGLTESRELAFIQALRQGNLRERFRQLELILLAQSHPKRT